jgi:hypothetical protein
LAVAVGAVVALVGWVLGLFLTNVSVAYVGSWSWYGSSGAQGVGLLAVIASIAAVGALYLKHAPNMNITWPAPFPVILLVIAGVGALAGLFGLFEALTFGAGVGFDIGKPITLYLVAGAVFAGGVVQIYGAYMEYAATAKPPV